MGAEDPESVGKGDVRALTAHLRLMTWIGKGEIDLRTS